MPIREYEKLAEDGVQSTVETRNLAIVSETDAPPEVEKLYAQFRKSFGRPQVPGILQCFATHPLLLEHMIGLAESMLFSEGHLGRTNREMLATFVSARNSCEYCADSHGFFLRMNGGSAELLDAAMTCDLHSAALAPDQSELLDAAMTCDLHSAALAPDQSELLRFVLKVTDSAESIEPRDTEALRAAGWADVQIAEAIHLAALFACFNRVVNAFGLKSQSLLAMYAQSGAL